MSDGVDLGERDHQNIKLASADVLSLGELTKNIAKLIVNMVLENM